MSDLLALIERLEKASGPDREIDADIASAVGWAPGPHYRRCSDNSWRLVISGHTEHDAINSVTWPPAYTSSIDVALTLVPEGMDWTIKKRARSMYQGRWPYESHVHNGKLHGDGYKGANDFSDHAAIALCIAALRARQQGDASCPTPPHPPRT